MKTTIALLALSTTLSSAAGFTLSEFGTRQLTGTYFSEGATAGDIDNDGHTDVVYGPHWYAGPNFTTAREIYPPQPQRMSGYADNFFVWLHDVDADGDSDILMVGLPGTPAFLFEHPGSDKLDQHWTKHQVFDFVGNESPQFTDLTGDGRPELVCTRQGIFGYATFNPTTPFTSWTFNPVSPRITAGRFGHGLGVGDVNSDGRLDIIHAGGWLEQPGDPTRENILWTHHPTRLTNSYGGADMFAYDVDGDGDNDIITSLAAHDFGLAWYEQSTGDDNKTTFTEHLIMGARKEDNRYGLVFSEPHSVALADIDGDGLKDIVTGKTYYSHHEQSPGWDAGAVVYWFKLERGDDRVDFVPHLAAANTGVGRQIGIFDVNKDGLPDILAGGMKGANLITQSRKTVDAKTYLAARPGVFTGGGTARHDRGPEEPIDDRTGTVPGAIEGESMTVLSSSTGNVGTQKMGGFKSDRWSGAAQLFWTGATPRARLHLEFENPTAGDYDVELSFTTASDYAIVNVLLDSSALGDPLDLYDYPDVRTTGTVSLGRRTLAAGKHKLTLETIGANPSAKKLHMVGLDYLRLVPVTP